MRIRSAELHFLEIPFRMSFGHGARAARVSSDSMVLRLTSGSRDGFGEAVVREYVSGSLGTGDEMRQEAARLTSAFLAPAEGPGHQLAAGGRDPCEDPLQPFVPSAAVRRGIRRPRLHGGGTGGGRLHRARARAAARERGVRRRPSLRDAGNGARAAFHVRAARASQPEGESRTGPGLQRGNARSLPAGARKRFRPPRGRQLGLDRLRRGRTPCDLRASRRPADRAAIPRFRVGRAGVTDGGAGLCHHGRRGGAHLRGRSLPCLLRQRPAPQPAPLEERRPGPCPGACRGGGGLRLVVPAGVHGGGDGDPLLHGQAGRIAPAAALLRRRQLRRNAPGAEHRHAELRIRVRGDWPRSAAGRGWDTSWRRIFFRSSAWPGSPV